MGLLLGPEVESQVERMPYVLVQGSQGLSSWPYRVDLGNPTYHNTYPHQ